jgi:hypothetical protein
VDTALHSHWLDVSTTRSGPTKKRKTAWRHPRPLELTLLLKHLYLPYPPTEGADGFVRSSVTPKMQKYIAQAVDRATAFHVTYPRASVAAQWTFAGIGALYISSKIFGFLYHFLKIFLIGGTNVSRGYAQCSMIFQGSMR